MRILLVLMIMFAIILGASLALFMAGHILAAVFLFLGVCVTIPFLGEW